jgi:hypothetical protein
MRWTLADVVSVGVKAQESSKCGGGGAQSQEGNMGESLRTQVKILVLGGVWAERLRRQWSYGFLNAEFRGKSGLNIILLAPDCRQCSKLSSHRE